jgi:hypothetical protein
MAGTGASVIPFMESRTLGHSLHLIEGNEHHLYVNSRPMLCLPHTHHRVWPCIIKVNSTISSQQSIVNRSLTGGYGV